MIYYYVTSFVTSFAQYGSSRYFIPFVIIR